jgi:hypothetical protein
VSMGLARYGDGEYGIIQHKEVDAKQDDWKIAAGNSKLAADLVWSLTGHMNLIYFYGYPSHEGIESLNYFLSETEQNLDYITFANMFGNANFPLTLVMLEKVMRGDAGSVVIVASASSRPTAFEKFSSLVSFLECPGSPSEYEGKRDDLVAAWKKLAASHKQTLFLLTCGPLASVAVAFMFEENPQNR